MPSSKTKTPRKAQAPIADTEVALVEANHAEQPPPADANETFLNAPQVCRRYGGISNMALHRWLADPKVDFPDPTIIGSRRYWRLSDLQVFERIRVSKKVQVSDAHISKQRQLAAG